MKRITAVLAAAVAVAVFTASALAGQHEQVAFTFSAISLGAQESTISDGNVLHERGHGYAGIVSDEVVCCELSLRLDRDVDLDTMRGSVSGTIVVAGNSADIRWDGELSGKIKPDGTSGKVVLHDSTGRTLKGKWDQAGNPDLTTFHSITITIEGKLAG